MIVEKILDSVKEKLRKRRVEEVRIGLGCTAVVLDDGSCGLAATSRHEINDCCSLMEEAGKLSGRGAYQVGEMVLSTDILESAVGLATINSIVNKDAESNTSPVMEALNIGKNDEVCMVGYFKPLADPVREKCKKLYILERRPSDEEFVHSDWACNILLPNCNLVIISGSTIINKTIDHLLELASGKVAIIGPSTSLSHIFKDYGVSFLFGSKVLDSDKVLRIVSEGGGTRSFGDAVDKINLKL